GAGVDGAGWLSAPVVDCTLYWGVGGLEYWLGPGGCVGCDNGRGTRKGDGADWRGDWIGFCAWPNSGRSAGAVRGNCAVLDCGGGSAGECIAGDNFIARNAQ